MLKPLIKQHGLILVRMKRHYRLQHPDRQNSVTISESASDYRAIANIRRDVIRLIEGEAK